MAIQNSFPAIKPTLLLDFANTKQLDPRITFTRASTGTFYDGRTVAKAEENLLLQSQSFATTAAWNAASNNTTVTANTTAAPDGTTTASTITDTTASSTYFAVQSVTGVSIPNAATTASVFLKSNTSQFAYLGLWDGTTYATAVVDLTGGTITSTSGSPSATSITSVGNGWYRVSVTKTINTSTFVQVGLSNSGTPTFSAGRPFYNGTASLSVFAWGAQLEQRSAVTAYTATTTQPITNYIPVLQTAASGVARFEHNPITFESLGLEIEEQRTNLLTYSEQFNDAAWTKSNATITANTIVAPDGTLTADKIVGTATTGYFSAIQTISVVSGNSYTKTVYAKAGEWRYAFLQVGGTSWTSQGQNSGIRFDLISGTVAGAYNGQSLANGTITSVGNGWYRISARWDCNTTTSLGTVLIGLTNTNNEATNTGNGFNGLFIWGAQLEVGAFPTSYIQTVASQVTRSADAASMTGTNFSSWYNAAQGTVYVNASGPASRVGVQTLWRMTDGTANNVISGFLASDGTRVQVLSGGVTQADQYNFAVSGSSEFKYVSGYAVNNITGALNAVASETDSSALIPATNNLQIGSRGGVADFLNGTIRKVAYYPLRVTNANLQALTS